MNRKAIRLQFVIIVTVPHVVGTLITLKEKRVHAVHSSYMINLLPLKSKYVSEACVFFSHETVVGA